VKKLPSNHTFRGKRYRITTATIRQLDGNDGDCDPPTEPEKLIRVNRALLKPENERELLEVLIHEAIHVCQWDLKEDAVEATGKAVADLVWRSGYRRII